MSLVDFVFEVEQKNTTYTEAYSQRIEAALLDVFSKIQQNLVIMVLTVWNNLGKNRKSSNRKVYYITSKWLCHRIMNLKIVHFYLDLAFVELSVITAGQDPLKFGFPQ